MIAAADFVVVTDGAGHLVVGSPDSVARLASVVLLDTAAPPDASLQFVAALLDVSARPETVVLLAAFARLDGVVRPDGLPDCGRQRDNRDDDHDTGDPSDDHDPCTNAEYSSNGYGPNSSSFYGNHRNVCGDTPAAY